MKTKYVHKENVHNLDAPRQIVPVLVDLFKPKSVVDIGCGVGTFLHSFREAGVQKLLGLDGSWANKELISKYLGPEEFKECNLEQQIQLDHYFDLVLSLEVAEHLSEKSADTFIESLVSAGKLIVFSAAIPLQGGQNHINEQWLTYWEEKFATHGYVMHDVLRPLFWDNPKVFWWYRQNMVLFAPKEFVFTPGLSVNPLKNIVHPELFTTKAQAVDDVLKKLEKVSSGELPAMTYAKLFLRSIIGNSSMEKLKGLFKNNK